MAHIQIREASIADAAGIARVHVLTWQHAYRGQMPDDFLDGLSIEQRTQNWFALLLARRTPKRTRWSRSTASRSWDFAAWGQVQNEDADEQNGELYAIYVDPQAMDKGLARR